MPQKVAVIGAGISGLAAASSLVERDFEVYLLEASDYYGGRLKQVEAFQGFPPVDLGGDFVHGSTHIVQDLAKKNGWKIKKGNECDDDGPMVSCIFVDGKLYSLNDQDHTDISTAQKVLDDIKIQAEKSLDANQPSDLFGISLHTWLKRNCFNRKVIDIINAYYCQTHGGTLDSIGVLEAGLDDALWQSGNGNYRLEESYSVLISHFVEKCANVDKRLNWPVKEIKWKEQHNDEEGKKIEIFSINGQSIKVDYAVITVPLTVLQSGDIIFQPPLPMDKQQAFNFFYMGTAYKIVCRFKKQFWGETIAGYCPGSFIQQVWMYSREPKPNGEECHVAVGFETAVAAAQKVHLSDETVCEGFMKQLDAMFRTDSDPKPASNNLVGFVYYHWSKHPYIRGGYSSPTVGTHGMKHKVASPLDDKLFFAGEATSIHEYATVQASLGTGLRAAEEVEKASRKNRKVASKV